SQGNTVPYTPGAVLPSGTNYLEVYYAGSRIYRSNIAGIGNPRITLEMLAIDNSAHYIALNSTATSIVPSEYSSMQVKFSITGPGPYLIIVNVPKKPLYVEVGGIRTADWVYDNTTKTIAITSPGQGAFLVALEQPGILQLYLIGGLSAVVALAIILVTY